ncbi:hypothetical protein BU25DRAFT_199621 [Macroventuria anomochaeta]|uniref:Uncharacterized protein n=1 Tax=Macroventuria anomochaeta TaxID=301207 RepID=A0ACB6RML6_9PLEO|nr:uncharacterized protein BU25DRAFT_199621 [Macroventuria anomochaeta]KAF2622978.1 hypothetical protein BU25DRAFT_199621 [Macroventuria anomochaeta]
MSDHTAATCIRSDQHFTYHPICTSCRNAVDFSETLLQLGPQVKKVRAFCRHTDDAIVEVAGYNVVKSCSSVCEGSPDHPAIGHIPEYSSTARRYFGVVPYERCSTVQGGKVVIRSKHPVGGNCLGRTSICMSQLSRAYRPAHKCGEGCPRMMHVVDIRPKYMVSCLPDVHFGPV